MINPMDGLEYDKVQHGNTLFHFAFLVFEDYQPVSIEIQGVEALLPSS